jgi:hypothetical protein
VSEWNENIETLLRMMATIEGVITKHNRAQPAGGGGGARPAGGGGAGGGGAGAYG